MKKLFYLLFLVPLLAQGQQDIKVRGPLVQVYKVNGTNDTTILKHSGDSSVITTTQSRLKSRKPFYAPLLYQNNQIVTTQSALNDSCYLLRGLIGTGGVSLHSSFLYWNPDSLSFMPYPVEPYRQGVLYWGTEYLGLDTTFAVSSINDGAIIGSSQNNVGVTGNSNFGTGLIGFSSESLGFEASTLNGYAHAIIGSNAGDSTVFLRGGELRKYSGSTYFYIKPNGFCGNYDMINNTVFGDSSMLKNTGSDNSAFGYYSLNRNITGNYNSAFGKYSLRKNYTGYYNVGIGASALYENTTGSWNSATGSYALTSCTTGGYNTANGYNAGRNNTTGSYNLFLGHLAGNYANTLNNRLYINTINRTTLNGDTTGSIIYGYQSSTVANQKLYFNATTQTQYYSYYKGTYAEIYRLRSSGDTTQSIPTGTTPTKVLAFNANGEASNCTADKANDKITITKAGRYRVTLSISYASGSAGVNWIAYIFSGGTEVPSIHTTGYTGNANDKRSTACSGIINVSSVPADIDYRVTHDNGSSVNLIFSFANLNVEYIGD